MADLRAQLLDAGIELVADQGVSGLTHDAVDARAGVAAGSTEVRFPTNRALVEGVTQRCIEREMEMASGPNGEIEASREGLASAFGAFAHRALGVDRATTLARYMLHAEAARTPALRAFYAVGADEVDTWALDLVRRAGSRHPERDYGIMANYVTGLVFHELALPTPGLDVAGRVRTLIDALGWRAA
ncbi:TetR family transcriptional regulator [Nocardioides cavernae]|uniref:TetR family transcriptional regulator n=1 Tax=Nocardioides cavernae TaxID=1921566 RepID=A0ABR8NCA6_9ACTN|nr:TetR/AcrR family transcriptional regulator [Nocardioides cavernae]MBD3925758.1 TetR family transcriptional regulator [Nocardioides cavernae]MBM7513343.1 DNA-binding transcriptional regulator YbjK [Nocardioides cavernae]